MTGSTQDQRLAASGRHDLHPPGLFTAWVFFQVLDRPSPPGSRGTLPCPSPLRTARESFPSSRSSLSNALGRDGASPPKVPGYGLGYGNLDEVARGSPADLPLRLLDVRYGDCSIP